MEDFKAMSPEQLKAAIKQRNAESFGLKYSQDDVIDTDCCDENDEHPIYLEPNKTMQEPRMRAIMQNIIDNNGEFKP